METDPRLWCFLAVVILEMPSFCTHIRKGALESCAAWKPGSTTYREVHAAGLGRVFLPPILWYKKFGDFFSKISWISTRKHKNLLWNCGKISSSNMAQWVPTKVYIFHHPNGPSNILSSFFFLGQSSNLIGPSLKKIWAMQAPQNRRFSFEVYIVPPLWPPSYRDERTTTFAKA